MAKKTNVWPMVGAWAFIIGLIIAILCGAFAPGNSTAMLVLGIIGIIVGLLNIADKEIMLFLLASITFVVAASSLENVVTGLLGVAVGGAIASILSYIVVMVAPGAAVVALKAIYQVSRE